MIKDKIAMPPVLRTFGPISHEFARPLYYDRANNCIGYGPTYGETSFNGNPLMLAPLQDFIGRPDVMPYNPFGRMKPF